MIYFRLGIERGYFSKIECVYLEMKVFLLRFGGDRGFWKKVSFKFKENIFKR